jgi:hypothetical protein
MRKMSDCSVRTVGVDGLPDGKYHTNDIRPTWFKVENGHIMTSKGEVRSLAGLKKLCSTVVGPFTGLDEESKKVVLDSLVSRLEDHPDFTRTEAALKAFEEFRGAYDYVNSHNADADWSRMKQEKEEFKKVGEALYEDTKDRNTRENCSLVGEYTIRRWVREWRFLKDSIDELENKGE